MENIFILYTWEVQDPHEEQIWMIFLIHKQYILDFESV
jgi:hypothetical protein